MIPVLLFVLTLLSLSVPTISLAAIGAFPPTQAGDESTPEAELSPQQCMNQGRYQEAITRAEERQAQLGRFGIDESLPVLIAEAHFKLGQYDRAQEAIEAGLERYERGIRVRWAAHRIYRYNDDLEDALRMLGEIEDLASSSAWMYRDTPNQLVLGKYFLFRGADPKQVLTSFYQPALERNAAAPEVYRCIGQLSLDKADYAMAADNFQQLIKIRPDDADALYCLALCYEPSDPERTTALVNQALTINPHHVGCQLLLADRQISSERYEDAIETLQKSLAVNPRHPESLAYLAAVAHLRNDSEAEAKYRNEALASWSANPEVDHVIGRELSEKYRFEEGQAYQRRALVYDENYLPAKIQLAHDLLRLGQEVEGWKLADEVFDEDQYSVLAHNLVMLRDELSEFTTLTRDGFVVRMSKTEAQIYGQDVLDLLSEASVQLADKYKVQLQTPVVVEIFPRQEDFAIRTFGLPGGSGFLGVCFGRVITMNSPAAQGAGLTSWKSVLWHEFCHVVTLQKTLNKMPRWLSEGISVYEEKQADTSWGESMSRRYRDMLLNELTPVSQLSGAFLRPPSPIHLQFAYYESSLVVEYLIQTHGLPKLRKVLDELAFGTPINEALAKHIEPVDELDAKFVAFATAKAEAYAPEVDWTTPETVPPDAGIDFWANWNVDHPKSLPGLLGESQSLIEAERFSEAVERLQEARQWCDTETGIYRLLARAYRGLEQPDDERQTLEAYAQLEASEPDLYLRLLELTEADGDWEATIRYAQRLLAVNPLMKPPHMALARAAEKTSNAELTARALSVLAEMNPLDVADVRFRLAQAHAQLNQWEQARRQVLMALEQAPRYRDAHRLLLKVNQHVEDRP